jgi:hypothetical protein
VAVPLIFWGSVDFNLGSADLEACGSIESGSEQVISISASLPQFSHLQTCFFTTFDMGFPFLIDGSKADEDQKNFIHFNSYS